MQEIPLNPKLTLAVTPLDLMWASHITSTIPETTQPLHLRQRHPRLTNYLHDANGGTIHWQPATRHRVQDSKQPLCYPMVLLSTTSLKIKAVRDIEIKV